MTDPNKTTVSAAGNATVSQRPSQLLLMGIIEATDATLQLTIQALEGKRKSLSDWLVSLGAVDIKFGETRFSDQVEPNPFSESKRMISRQMELATGNVPDEDDDKRLLVVSYAASWQLAELSSAETLVLVDRIQFETENLQEKTGSDAEQQTNWSENPSRELGAMMSAITTQHEPPKNVMLFSSCLSEELRQQAVGEAFQDAVCRARRLAKAAGGELGELQSINSYSTENDDHRDLSRYQRLQANPVLQEVPFRSKKGEVLSETPRSIDFNFSLNATFLLDASSKTSG